MASTLSSNKIKKNDTLILRDKETPLPFELLYFNISFTKTGWPSDLEYLEIISLKESATFNDLKSKILSMPRFSDLNIETNKIRIREVKRDLNIGKIFKNTESTFKQLGIKTQTSLAFQILDQEEELQENDIQLFVKKRNVKEKNYENCREIIFHATKEPTILELKQQISQEFQLMNEFTLGKYVQHEFKWIPITQEYFNKDNKKIKSKKKQNQKVNLRKTPFLLKDGEVISFRIEEENVNNEDDFQTIEDKQNKLIQLREIKKSKHIANQEFNSGKSHRNEGVGFKIFTKDF